MAGKKAGARGKKLPAGATVSCLHGLAQAVSNVRKPGTPACIVLLCCLIYAFQLGMHEPYFYYQEAAAHAVFANGSGIARVEAAAFAAGSTLAVPIMHEGNYSVRAVFDGSGSMDRAELDFEEAGANITLLQINGRQVCAPCNKSGKYPLDLGETGPVEVYAQASDAVLAFLNSSARQEAAFFKKTLPTQVEPLLKIELAGGWNAARKESMPASFYRIDAPFHIARIPVLAEYLSRGEWPYATYSFISVLPATAIYLALGSTPQYAFKIYEIVLFFVPVALFYFFSRKASSGKDAIFLFSSLLYLYLPTRGLLTGGGPDLFLYGMMPHTLATYLSLAFFYFGYEFVFDKKRGALLPAAVLFGLAFLCNARILLALGLIAFALAAAALVAGRLKRMAFLGAACLASIAWSALPFLQSMQLAGYGALGGVSISSGGQQAAFAFLETGYVILPVLSLAGAYAVWKRKELFAGILAASALLVLLVATNPTLNAQFPFLDGVRFLPSFFLPMFFLGGMGAHLIWEMARKRAEGARIRLKMDDLTFAGAVAFALLVPLAATFATAMLTTTEQYSPQAQLPDVAAERAFLENVGGIAADGYVAFAPIGPVSHYPATYRGFYFLGDVDYVDAGQLAKTMATTHIRYVILGAAKHVAGAEEKTRFQEYLDIKSDSRFIELISTGSGRLFALREVEPANASGFYAPGVEMQDSEVRLDRVRLKGECLREPCEILLYNQAPPNSRCTSSQGSCAVVVDSAAQAPKITGISQGAFEITTEPENYSYVLPLALLGAAVLAGSFAFCRD